MGLGLRLALLIAVPNLSDDFYRFIWDGRLIGAGINPFAELPVFYHENPALAPAGITRSLLENLNSPEYFTIYPPVMQLVFWISTAFSDQELVSIIIMRLVILLAETGTMWLMIKILKLTRQNESTLAWYAFNPLVILELTGNLHFEGLMIFFLMLMIYSFQKQKLNRSAISLGLAVLTKLNPLIFAPMLIRKLNTAKLSKYYLLLAVVALLGFMPLISPDLIDGLSQSIGLYFQKFEFNASIYYLVRYIGFQIKGYNIIATAGKILSIAAFAGIMIYSLSNKCKYNHLPQNMLWIYLIYLLLATIVHPWYVTPLMALMLFTPYRWPVLWSFSIFFTYINYQSGGYYENLWVVAIEYLTLGIYLLWEILNKKGGLDLKKIWQ